MRKRRLTSDLLHSVYGKLETFESCEERSAWERFVNEPWVVVRVGFVCLFLRSVGQKTYHSYPLNKLVELSSVHHRNLLFKRVPIRVVDSVVNVSLGKVLPLKRV